VNEKKKAFVSVDMEGLPHIVSMEHMFPGRYLYNEARSIMTDCVLAMVEELHGLGVKRVVVADSHGPMVNLIPDKMPSYVSIVRGSSRSLSMVSGGNDADMALFLGYHAKPGSANSTFDHTMSGNVFRSVKCNGVDSSEFYINAAVLGEQRVPIVLVAGDKTLLDEDVRKFAPWSVRVPLKESLGRYASISPSMSECLELIRKGVRESVSKFEEMKPLSVKSPVDLEISFTSTAYAHIASHLPGSRRADRGWGVAYTAKSMTEAYLVTELLLSAAGGVRANVDPK